MPIARLRTRVRRFFLRWRLHGLIERVRRVGRLISLLGRSGRSSLLVRFSARWLEEPKVSAFFRGHAEFVSFPKGCRK